MKPNLQTLKSIRNTLGAFALTALSSLLIQAQNEQTAPEAVSLTPLIVTGETYAFGAQKLILVTEDDLNRLQPIDLEDIFTQDPSVRVGGGIGVAEKIYVRGIEDKLLNVSIDGAPQGGYLSHHQSQFTIEPELLKYVEVEPGPGGALQGAGALAGAIRFVTKDARDFLSEEQQFGAFNKASYLSNGEGVKLTSTLYGRVGENATVLAAFTWMDIGDYEDGDGNTVDYTAHKQTRGFVKATTQTNDGQHAVSLSYETIQDKGTFRHRPNFFGYFNHPVAPNDPIDMVFSRDTFTAAYSQSPEDAARGLEATVYSTDNITHHKGQYDMGYASLGLDVHHGLVLGSEENHALTFGVDYRADTMNFTGGGSITGFIRALNYVTIPDETVDIAGLYIQDQWQVSDAFQVSLGVRADSYDYTDKDGKNYTATGISPTLGLSYAFTKQLSFNGSYGYAFRGPTVIDAITANEGSITNADSIDAEQATNGEIGLAYTHGIFNFAATAYQQEIDNIIVNSSLNQPGFRGNGGKLKVAGYDLSAAVRLGDFTTSLAVSESDPELNGTTLTDTSFGLGSAYGRAWTSLFNYDLSAANLRFGWSIELVEDFNDVPAGIPAKSGYTVHGASVEWQPSERFTLMLSGRNLFNKAYVDQATAGYNSQLSRIAGLPAAGRDIRVSASFKF